MSQIDKQIIYFQLFNKLIITATIITVLILGYWTVEPDPVTITTVGKGYSECSMEIYMYRIDGMI